MDRQEAKQFWRRVFTAFPSYRAWLKRQGDNEQESNEVYYAWCDMLKPVRQEDAITVLHEIQRGRIELPQSFDRERLPLVIVRAAQDIMNKRAERENAQRLSGIANDLPKDATQHERFIRAKRQSTYFGEALQKGLIDKPQNDYGVEQCCEYMHGTREALPLLAEVRQFKGPANDEVTTDDAN